MVNGELCKTEIELMAKAEVANKTTMNDKSHQYLSNFRMGEFPKRFFDKLQNVDIKNIAADTHKTTTWVSCLNSGLGISKRYKYESENKECVIFAGDGNDRLQIFNGAQVRNNLFSFRTKEIQTPPYKVPG